MNFKDLNATILTIIELLLKRKARPDLPRITRKLIKLAGAKGVIISSAEAHEKVENMVDEGYLIKVEYKGNYTYKDAIKWKKGKVSGHIINSDMLSAKLQWAVTCIGTLRSGRAPSSTGENADAAEMENCDEPMKGATPEDIEDWFKNCTDPQYKCVLRKGAMFDVLTREVEMNRLQKSPEDGSYTVGKVKMEMGLPNSSAQLQKVKIEPSESCVDKDCKEKTSPTNNDSQLVKAAEYSGEVRTTQDESAGETNGDDTSQRPRPKRKIISKFDEDSIYAVTPIKKLKSKEACASGAQKSRNRDKVPASRTSYTFGDDASGTGYRSSSQIDRKCEESHLSSKHNMDIPQPLTPADEWIHINTHSFREAPISNGVYHDDDSQSEHESATMKQQLPLSPVTSASNSTDSLLLKPFSVCDKCHQVIKPPRGLNECDGFDFPDMTDFTAEEVFSYMSTFAGGKYAEQAKVLKDEDIDGNALMILSRADILKLQEQGKLLLGPALKLNHLIKNIKLKGCAQYYKHD